MKFRNKILNFNKTEHFLDRQWNRKMDDELLTKCLKFLNTPIFPKEIMIVKPNFIRRLNITKVEEQSIVIVIKEMNLITCYWCKHIEFLLRKEKNIRYQILDYFPDSQNQIKTSITFKIN